MLRNASPEMTQLGDLLALVAQGPEDEPGRDVHEHLREAFQHLAAGRFPEYVHALEFARRAAKGMTDHSLRRAVGRSIAQLIEVSQAA